MYIGKRAKEFANTIGLKLWVTKHDCGKQVLNIYDIERDRMLVNYEGYGKGFCRGRRKILAESAFRKLPFTIGTNRKLTETLEQIALFVKNGEIE